MGRRSLFLLLGLFLLGCTQEIPFEISDNRILISGTWNGRPLTALLDTGSFGSAINPDFLTEQERGTALPSRIPLSRFSGGSRTPYRGSEKAVIPGSLVLGGWRLRDLEFKLLPHEDFWKEGFDMVLGMDAFVHTPFLLDFDRSVIELGASKPSHTSRQWKGSLRARKLTTFGQYRGRFKSFAMDTGNPYAFILAFPPDRSSEPGSYLEVVSSTPATRLKASSSSTQKYGFYRYLEISNGLKIQGTPAVYDRSAPVNWVGLPVIRQYNLWVDLSQEYFYFWKNHQSYDLSKPFLTLGGARISQGRVISVIPGSPASHRLLPGDLILNFGSFQTFRMKESTKQGDPFILEVDRDGKGFTVLLKMLPLFP